MAGRTPDVRPCHCAVAAPKGDTGEGKVAGLQHDVAELEHAGLAGFASVCTDCVGTVFAERCRLPADSAVLLKVSFIFGVLDAYHPLYRLFAQGSDLSG